MLRNYILIVLGSSLSFVSYTQDWKSKLGEARNLYKKGNYKDALTKYEEAKNLAPETIDFTSEIGQAAYKSGEFEKAQSYYDFGNDEAKKKKASSNQFHNLGNSQMRTKNYRNAVESYKEALRKNPNDAETRYNLSEALRNLKKDDKNNQPQNPPPPQNDEKKKEDPKKKENKPNKPNGDLPKRAVDRMLDKLSKKEAETKRKINNQRNKEQNNSKSGKDW